MTKMTPEDQSSQVFDDKEHQVAYIFDPADEVQGAVRPAKRRKVFERHGKEATEPAESSAALFQPLFSKDTEGEASVQLRQHLYEKAWADMDKRIHHVLRETNQSTLDNVTSFIQESLNRDDRDKIPSGFIVTGANIASQELLFEQISESLQDHSDAKVVLLRSADASNLKAALKKIIHGVTARATEDGDDIEVAVGKDGRKYLNYDLEALYSHLKNNPQTHVVICFQDSEAFETGLLSDLILLLSSWLDRIPFALLFGVATSVELFQARLLKSTCRHLHGDQFDVEQTTYVVEKIFKTAVAHAAAPLRLGSSFLQSLLERQRDQVAGLPLLVNSLKYAYMCHYYANPTSIFLSQNLGNDLLSKEMLETLRSLPSFRASIEKMLDSGDVTTVRSLLDDDNVLVEYAKKQQNRLNEWVQLLLRNVSILTACQTIKYDFVQSYLDALVNGIDISNDHQEFIDTMQRASPEECISFLDRVLGIVKNGDANTGLESRTEADKKNIEALSEILAEIQKLHEQAEEDDVNLKSKYSGHNKVLRTTVIAQKVQLSQDTADLTDEDKAYTELVDRLVQLLKSLLNTEKVEDIALHEVWFYDLKTPYRDVFIPRPRTVIERALSRPHDYLGCSCCRNGNDEIKPTLPATAILYHLYLETGSLINVADLWSAFYAIVGDENNDDGLDERTALVLFYRAISELKALGFVKQSRKKVDHIAKLAWHGL